MLIHTLLLSVGAADADAYREEAPSLISFGTLVLLVLLLGAVVAISAYFYNKYEKAQSLAKARRQLADEAQAHAVTVAVDGATPEERNTNLREAVRSHLF